MKKPTPKRFRYFNNKCYIMNKLHLLKVEELKQEIRSKVFFDQKWEEAHDNLLKKLDEKTDRLNQLSKHYNDLIVEHKEMKDQNFDYKNQLQNISQERNDLFNANLSLSVSGNEKDAEIKKLHRNNRIFTVIAVIILILAMII